MPNGKDPRKIPVTVESYGHGSVKGGEVPEGTLYDPIKDVSLNPNTMPLVHSRYKGGREQVVTPTKVHDVAAGPVNLNISSKKVLDAAKKASSPTAFLISLSAIGERIVLSFKNILAI